MLNFLRRKKAPSTAADLREALAAIDIPALEAAVDAARCERAEMLLSGPASAVLAAEKKADLARVELERGELAKAELEARLHSAIEDEAAAERQRRRDDITSKRAAVIGRIETEYASLAGQIVAIAEEAHEVDKAASEFNRDRAGMPGIEPIGADLWSEFFDRPDLYSNVSLLPAADFPGYGEALRAPTKALMHAVYGIGAPPAPASK
jgi:hypothetical protein